ncbi:hypothetical protein G7054_g12424 [Neopestalotiopsis clavispora]|nr:hypothetical protein G7054_g12424 [Neopestalotiopsis clavispora]
MNPTNELSTEVAPEDDWRMMSNFADKRRAQNRLAQRNYRRNMKQRIRDLEEQLATQISMLANSGTPEGKPVDWQSQDTKAPQGNIESQTRSQLPVSQKVVLITLFHSTLSLTGHLFQEMDSSAFMITQETLRPQFSEEQGMFWSASRDLQAHTDVLMQGKSDEQTIVDPSIYVTNQIDQIVGEGRQNFRKPNQQSSGDWNSQIYDEANFLEQFGRTNWTAASARGAWEASSPSWSKYVKSAQSSSRPPAAATLQQRIELLLKCSEVAGFRDFDTAIYNFYTEKPEGPSWSAARESSDRYGLSELLREICAGSPNWAGDQARCFKDHILHSAEEVLLSELRAFAEPERSDSMDAFSSHIAQGHNQ